MIRVVFCLLIASLPVTSFSQLKVDLDRQIVASLGLLSATMEAATAAQPTPSKETVEVFNSLVNEVWKSSYHANIWEDIHNQLSSTWKLKVDMEHRFNLALCKANTIDSLKIRLLASDVHTMMGESFDRLKSDIQTLDPTWAQQLHFSYSKLEETYTARLERMANAPKGSRTINSRSLGFSFNKDFFREEAIHQGGIAIEQVIISSKLKDSFIRLIDPTLLKQKLLLDGPFKNLRLPWLESLPTRMFAYSGKKAAEDTLRPMLYSGLGKNFAEVRTEDILEQAKKDGKVMSLDDLEKHPELELGAQAFEIKDMEDYIKNFGQFLGRSSFFGISKILSWDLQTYGVQYEVMKLFDNMHTFTSKDATESEVHSSAYYLNPLQKIAFDTAFFAAGDLIAFSAKALYSRIFGKTDTRPTVGYVESAGTFYKIHDKPKSPNDQLIFEAQSTHPKLPYSIVEKLKWKTAPIIKKLSIADKIGKNIKWFGGYFGRQAKNSLIDTAVKYSIVQAKSRLGWVDLEQDKGDLSSGPLKEIYVYKDHTYPTRVTIDIGKRVLDRLATNLYNQIKPTIESSLGLGNEPVGITQHNGVWLYVYSTDERTAEVR